MKLLWVDELAEPLDELVVLRVVHFDSLRADVAVVKLGLVQNCACMDYLIEHVSQFGAGEPNQVFLFSSLQFDVNVMIWELEVQLDPVNGRAKVASTSGRVVHEGQETLVVDR